MYSLHFVFEFASPGQPGFRVKPGGRIWCSCLDKVKDCNTNSAWSNIQRFTAVGSTTLSEHVCSIDLLVSKQSHCSGECSFFEDKDWLFHQVCAFVEDRSIRDPGTTSPPCLPCSGRPECATRVRHAGLDGKRRPVALLDPGPTGAQQLRSGVCGLGAFGSVS